MSFHLLLINWLNNSFEWKLLGSITGVNAITLPNNFNELFATVGINTNATVLCSFSIPRIALTEETKEFANVYSTDNNGYCGIKVSLSQIIIKDVYNGTNNIKNSSRLTVYYR